MAGPVTYRSLDGVSAATAGDHTAMKGHFHTTLFVVAENLDPANDTLEVALEGSPDEVHWTDFADATSSKHLNESDFDQDPTSGVYTASVSISGAYHDFARARVVNFIDSASGDLTITAFVMSAGRDSSGQQGKPEHGP